MTEFKHLENPVDPPIYFEDILGMVGIVFVLIVFMFLEPILDALKGLIL